MNRGIESMKRLGRIALALGSLATQAGCNQSQQATPPMVPVTSLPGHGDLVEDTTPKEAPRMVPTEAYIRSYLMLFGNLSPVAAQAAGRGKDGSALFDSWNDYLSSLGLPDYRVDVPRGIQTNTLMLATFERLGIALCDRSIEHDWQAMTPVAQRTVFAFDDPASKAGAVSAAAFAPGFDVLHRTFLGYPASLGPTDRAPRYFKLYSDAAALHANVKSSRFTPSQAGWAAVCYGLVRHPEFHLY